MALWFPNGRTYPFLRGMYILTPRNMTVAAGFIIP